MQLRNYLMPHICILGFERYRYVAIVRAVIPSASGPDDIATISGTFERVAVGSVSFCKYQVSLLVSQASETPAMWLMYI